VLVPGLAEVHVGIDQAGCDEAAGGVDDAVGGRPREVLGDVGDLAVADRDIREFIAARGGIEDAPAGDQE